MFDSFKKTFTEMWSELHEEWIESTRTERRTETETRTASGEPVWHPSGGRVRTLDAEASVVVEIDLPGVAAADVAVTVARDGTSALVVGRRAGRSFRCRLRFGAPPVVAESAAAHLRQGVLTLTLAKRAATAATDVSVKVTGA